jgi:hypothetical protein
MPAFLRFSMRAVNVTQSSGRAQYDLYTGQGQFLLLGAHASGVLELRESAEDRGGDRRAGVFLSVAEVKLSTTKD